MAKRIVAELNGKRSPTSQRAVRRLVALATETIHQLERLWKEGNPWIFDVARDRIDWPVLTGHHHAILQRSADWIEGIELGKNARTRLLIAQLPSRRTPARIQALHLLDLVAHVKESAIWGESIHGDITKCDESFLRILRFWLCQHYTPTLFRKVILTWRLILKIKRLPILGPDTETVSCWQSVTLEFLALNCGDAPSSIPPLYLLGEHKRYHPYSKSIGPKLLETLVSKEQQAKNASREIREILKEEIRKVGNEIGKAKKPSDNSAKRSRKRTNTRDVEKSG